MKLGKVLFMVFLGIAAWQDARSKEVDAWLYVVFGGLVWFEKLCFSWPVQMGPEILNILPGAAMLLLSRWSEGAIGEGDGWFFVIAGVALGWKKSVAVFLAGLFLCCIWCTGLAVWGKVRHVSVRERTVPFLPFAVPAVLWMLTL